MYTRANRYQKERSTLSLYYLLHSIVCPLSASFVLLAILLLALQHSSGYANRAMVFIDSYKTKYEFIEISYSHWTVPIYSPTAFFFLSLHSFHTTQYNLSCIFTTLYTFQKLANSEIVNFCNLAVYIIRYDEYF